MEAYTDNAKLKFLKDFVVCMFIEFETERIFQNVPHNVNPDNLHKQRDHPGENWGIWTNFKRFNKTE